MTPTKEKKHLTIGQIWPFMAIGVTITIAVVGYAIGYGQLKEQAVDSATVKTVVSEEINDHDSCAGSHPDLRTAIQELAIQQKQMIVKVNAVDSSLHDFTTDEKHYREIETIKREQDKKEILDAIKGSNGGG